MYNNEKTSNFLKAIDKYAKQQQTKMLEELEKAEKKEIEKAENEIMEDVHNMIQRELVNMRSRIAVDISHKELELRGNLAKKRQRIVKDIFTSCKEKLLDFTLTSGYSAFLKKYAGKISEVMNSDDVILYIKPEDSKFKDIIREGFGRKCMIEYSDTISIGGLYGFSDSCKIIADETLDSRLNEQKNWFNETHGITLI